MSERNKRLVRRALEEIYARGNLELANELVHPDFVDHEPAHPRQPTGPESVKQTARRLQSAFGGLRFEVQDEMIVDHWGSRDDLGLLAQLGLLPAGEQPEAGF